MDNFVVVHTNRQMPPKGNLTPLSHIWRKLFPYTFHGDIAPVSDCFWPRFGALLCFKEIVNWAAGSAPIQGEVIFVHRAVALRENRTLIAIISGRLTFWLDKSGLIKLRPLSLYRVRVVRVPLPHHVQWHPILDDRKSASIQKLNRAQIGGGLQVLMTLRATEPEHVVIRHVCMVFLEDCRGPASLASR
jgi:hypothetical protein